MRSGSGKSSKPTAPIWKNCGRSSAGKSTSSLRVLHKDAIAKIATKRELFGDMLVELNRRILEMAGLNSIGGTVEFKDMLPENETEEVAALQQDLAAGLVSKETAALRRGYDWENEKEKMAGEQSQSDNVGALLLRQFSRGQ